MYTLVRLLAIGLTVTFAVCIGLIHAQPHDDSSVHAMLAPSDDCAMPCWQGIRPGVTSVGEARAILERHPWVKDVQLNGDISLGVQYGSLTWNWSGLQPFLAYPSSGGAIGIARNIVRSMTLQTRLNFGSIWLALDHPENGRLFYDSLEGSWPPAVYCLVYYHPDAGVITFVTCQHFWDWADVTLNYVQENADTSGGSPLITVRQASCQL